MNLDLDLDVVLGLLIQYKYSLMFPVAILEGPIITVIGAFLASQGFMNLYAVFGIAILGDLVGDMLYYAIGVWAKRLSYVSWGRWLGMTHERVLRLEHHFGAGGGKTLLYGKLTHAVGFATLIGAGIARMPVKRFLWFSFLGALPKCLLFLLLGYYIGYAYKSIDSYLARITLVLLVLAGCWVIIYAVYNRKRD